MASPAVDVERVRRYGFSEFVKLAWPIIEATPLTFEPHMQLVADHLQAVSRGEIKDIVISVPPGTSKSTMSSVLYPAWSWIERPWLKFICTSYAEKLSHGFGRRSMHLIQSQWWQDRWPHVVIEGGDRAAVGMFENSLGGVRFSTMMNGEATGRHAHILLADDATKPGELKGGGDSAMASLDNTWTLWTETFCRRVADAKMFAKICIAQRLHEADLPGRMLKDEKVVNLCLPMRFEPSRAYRSQWGNDWRTEEGQLLCPLRFPEEYVHDVQHGPTGLTPRAFAAQFQQRPAPEAGALFMRPWFEQRWDTLPVGGRFLMSVDASLKDNHDSDYCVLQTWYYIGAQYYLVDEYRKQMAFSDTVEAVKMLRQKWPKIGQVLIEDKANGTAIVDVLKRTMPGVLPINPQGGKYARANAVEPFVRAGNVWFPRTQWMGDFIEECAAFPVGANDDRVDAMTQALLFMSGRNRGIRFKKAMANVRGGALMARPRR